MATDDPDDEHIAPLPPHERPWRHPSELARAQRATTSIPPPPLNRIIAGVALGVAVVLSIVLVVLVLPRTGGREDPPAAEASAQSTLPPSTPPTSRHHSALGIAPLEQSGRTYLFPVAVLPSDLFSPVGLSAITDTLFVAAGFVSAVGESGTERPLTLTTAAGSLLPLSVIHRDPLTGLSLLRSALPIPASRDNIEVTPQTVAEAGTTMILHGSIEHRVKVGLRVASTAIDAFVPVDVDDVTKNFVDAAPVTDVNGHLAGLFVHRNGAVGMIPVSAIVSFVERALQPPG